MKKLFSILTPILLIITLAGCNKASTTQQENESGLQKETKIVKIGLVGPLSGPAANYGEDMVNIHTYLAEQFNQQQQNVYVKLIIEDGKCSGKDATSATQKLVNIDKVDIFNGAGCSSEGISLGKLAQQNNILFVNGVPSSPEMAKIGDWIFNYVNDRYAAKKLSEFVVTKTPNIVLVYDNNDYGKGISEAIIEFFTGNIIKKIALSPEEKDFSILIQQIKNTDAEGIIFINGNDTTLISEMKELQHQGLLERFKGNIFGAYVFDSEIVRSQVGNLLEGSYQVNIAAVSEFGKEGKDFMDEYQKAHTIKANAAFSLVWAEAFSITLDAIKEGNYNSQDIKNYISEYTKDNPRSGLIGQYYFDNNQAIGVKYIIQQLQNGSLITIQ